MKVSNQEQTLYFTEENSTEAVLARMNNCSDPRFRQIMTSVITHLHAAVKEIEPTMEEWFDAIRFLTWAGQICTDRRQEWILLSDVLGVSMLVDAINNRKPSGATAIDRARPIPCGLGARARPRRQYISGWQGNAACGFGTRHRHQRQPHRRRHP